MSLLHRENRNRLTQIMLLKSLLQVSLCGPFLLGLCGRQRLPRPRVGSSCAGCRCTNMSVRRAEGPAASPCPSHQPAGRTQSWAVRAGVRCLIFTQVPHQLLIALPLHMVFVLRWNLLVPAPSPSNDLLRFFPTVPSWVSPQSPRHRLFVCLFACLLYIPLFAPLQPSLGLETHCSQTLFPWPTC